VVTSLLRQDFEAKEFKNLWYVGYWDEAHIEANSKYLLTRWPDLLKETKPMKFFWSFCTFLILYCNFIPLSLYISLELAFVMLVNFVNWDVKMYHGETDTPALARSPTVTDLGQVQYIFSDKTGTLTRNEMKLRRLIVHGVVYNIYENSEVKSHGPKGAVGMNLHEDLQFETIDILATRSIDAGDEFAAMTLETLMLCNTVVVESKSGGLKYQAESPDEGALVEGAAVAGYILCGRTEHTICGTTPASGGRRRVWQILATNEFDNDRKRMSIFVREMEENNYEPRDSKELSKSSHRLRGRIMLLCKGADNSMFSRAAQSSDDLDDLHKTLDTFAAEGLRTLVFGVRVYSDEEYSHWYSAHYSPAISAMHDRDILLKRAASEAENRLTIVGASAIEDKLQEGVPNTIATLADAGIKLWILTGDKRETAMEIGKSCRLLRPGMNIAVLSSSSEDRELQACLIELYLSANADFTLRKDTKLRVSARVEAFQRQRALGGNLSNRKSVVWGQDAHQRLPNLTRAKRALVVDGEAMHKLFGDLALEAMLFCVLAVCDAVIACRVTPKQKAQLVLLVHEHVTPTPVTLAIGDGANDVNMIMSAQVGVGISGHEGLQAVNASDFAIAQFQFLRRLLLVHGRWGYRRVCVLILYSFYKNACLAATLFFYCFYTGYSGTSLFSDYFTAFFNFFLFLLIYYTSILDQDVDDDYIEHHPQLYASGRENLDLNIPLALKWILLSSIHAVIIFIIPALALKDGTGSVHDLGAYYPFGAVVSAGLIVTMNVKVLFETRYFTTLNAGIGITGGHLGCLASTWFALAFNVIFFYVALILASVMGDKVDFMFQLLPFWKVGGIVLQKQTPWLLTMLVVGACCAVDLTQRGLGLFLKNDPISISIEHCRLTQD